MQQTVGEVCGGGERSTSPTRLLPGASGERSQGSAVEHAVSQPTRKEHNAPDVHLESSEGIGAHDVPMSDDLVSEPEDTRVAEGRSETK